MSKRYGTRLTENAIPPEPYMLFLCMKCILAYIDGNICGTTDGSIRRILQPEKRLEGERYK